MNRRQLLSAAAVLPLAACGGQLNAIPAALDAVSKVPAAVAEVSDLIKDISAGLDGGLAPLVQGIPAVAEVTKVLSTINSAVDRVRKVTDTVSAAPIVSEVASAVSRLWEMAQVLGPKAKPLIDAAISLVPTLEGLVGIHRAGRVYVPVPPVQARALLRAVARR